MPLLSDAVPTGQVPLALEHDLPQLSSGHPPPSSGGKRAFDQITLITAPLQVSLLII
jgi:hypothetical protein